MRAITLYQPYATGCVVGAKKHETRNRPTNIRGRVAIHASIKAVPVDMTPELRQSLGRLEYGAIVGTVEIVGCRRVEEVRDGLTADELAMGDYSAGRWAWELANPVQLDKPIPCMGHQGWFNVEGVPGND